jgi:WD40 repeat protein
MLQELKGHVKAVTSIDWKVMEDGQEYFVSCSDDNNVRIYTSQNNNGELTLHHTFNTHFLGDWHTLTYLSLEEGRQHLAAVSEHGYLFVWNIMAKQMVYSSKIHNGSIEALAWKGNTLVCCSSDCTFSTINLTNAATSAKI